MTLASLFLRLALLQALSLSYLELVIFPSFNLLGSYLGQTRCQAQDQVQDEQRRHRGVYITHVGWGWWGIEIHCGNCNGAKCKPDGENPGRLHRGKGTQMGHQRRAGVFWVEKTGRNTSVGGICKLSILQNMQGVWKHCIVQLGVLGKQERWGQNERSGRALKTRNVNIILGVKGGQ